MVAVSELKASAGKSSSMVAPVREQSLDSPQI